MSKTLTEFLKLQDLLSKLVKEAQDEGHLPTVRELAKKMKTTNENVLICAEDIGLNINIGIQSGNGVYVEKFKGSYTIEDLEYPLAGT